MERFWTKVAKSDGCWEWQGTRNPRGYGVFMGHNAHRVAMWFSVDVMTLVGKEVHHLCENKGCVRPDHLEVLTRAEHKSRHPRGKHGPRSNVKGSLLQLKDGYWRMRVATLSGAPRQASRNVRGTEEDARAALDRFVVEVRGPQH